MAPSGNDEAIRVFTRANKAAWDASAPLHGEGAGWEELLAAAGQPGFSVLDECLVTTLSALDAAGRSAVQIGCNNARELLSLAALGIKPALGIDQSAEFLGQAARLAAAAGRGVRLVEADVYDLPEGLGRYDLVLITIGVLSWMPDIARFFAVVRGLMRPGALLVIYETHPLMEMFDPCGPAPLVPARSYFDPGPIEIDARITYDGSDGGEGEPGYWFAHTLGEIVTACVSHGMCLKRLEEHPHHNREVDYDIYESRQAQMPLSYTLVAQAAG